ncbi:MAG: radical SAM protein [Clostridia bacterium]|nr:radical SAM protein [Clostridia bacterium]
MKCDLCPRKCGINRNESVGFCGVTNTLKVARAGLHFWEEPIISGSSGSGTIFFSGCNLKCVYCQNYDISSEAFGKEITIERLAEIFKELEEKGANNINLVTPSHYAKQIVEALKIYRPNIPIVYNTSGYDSLEVLKLMEGWVDVYLTDLKYCSSELSKKYSKAENYFEVATSAILEMVRQQPNNVFENGMLKKGVVVRHMVLPTHTQDSFKVLDWIKQNLGDEALVSVMGQYTPYYNSKNYPEINRKLKPLEYKMVLNHCIKLGLTNGFSQELDSASEEYIPPFNLEGV